MNLWQRFKLVTRLRDCPHWNTSEQLPGDRIQVCYDCGATRRPMETTWTAPWYWRPEPVWKRDEEKKAA